MKWIGESIITLQSDWGTVWPEGVSICFIITTAMAALEAMRLNTCSNFPH